MIIYFYILFKTNVGRDYLQIMDRPLVAGLSSISARLSMKTGLCKRGRKTFPSLVLPIVCTSSTVSWISSSKSNIGNGPFHELREDVYTGPLVSDGQRRRAMF